MPDLKNYTVTALANASVTVPRFQISGRVVDSVTGAVLFDFTGANAIVFPDDMIGKLTVQERRDFVSLIENFLVQRISKKFG